MEGTQNNYYWVSHRQGKVYVLLTGSHWSVPVAQWDATCKERIWKVIAFINSAHLLFPPPSPVIGPRYNKNLSLCDAMPSAWNDGPLSLLYLLFQSRQKLIPNATIWRQNGCFFRISWEKLSHENHLKYEKLFSTCGLPACMRSA